MFKPNKQQGYTEKKQKRSDHEKPNRQTNRQRKQKKQNQFVHPCESIPTVHSEFFARILFTVNSKIFARILFTVNSEIFARILFTVNSEIFARVLFSRNFAYAKFRENKILAKWRNHSFGY